MTTDLTAIFELNMNQHDVYFDEPSKYDYENNIEITEDLSQIDPTPLNIDQLADIKKDLDNMEYKLSVMDAKFNALESRLDRLIENLEKQINRPKKVS